MIQSRRTWLLSAMLALSTVACSDSDRDVGSTDTPRDADADRRDVGREGGDDSATGAGDSDVLEGDGALEDAIAQQDGSSDVASVDDKDLCPEDPHKTDPGKCGCGIPDTRVCGKLLRQDFQDAIVHTMWAYYFKRKSAQYDFFNLLKYKRVDEFDVWVWPSRGSNSRITTEVSPEYATSDTTLFSICTSYPYMSMFHSVVQNRKPYRFNAKTGSAAAYYPYYNATSRQLWRDVPNTAVIMRWSKINFEDANRYAFEDDLKERKYLSEVDYPTSKGWKTQQSYQVFKDYTPEKLQQWWASGKWESFLQPADIILYFTNDFGHAIEYVGNGMVLESAGNPLSIGEITTITSAPNVELYNSTFSDANQEEDGTFNLYSIKDYFCKEKSGHNVTRKDDNGVYWYREVMIVRPIDLMVKEDENGNVTDDIKPEYSITPSALSRIRYPGMEIDRTVNLTPYGTAFENEQVTYRIRVTNHTQSVYQGLDQSGHTLNEENVNHRISFASWLKEWAAARGHAAPKDYKGVVVTDVIPSGTRLVNEDKYDYDPATGTIRWKLDIDAGQTAHLSYSVVLKESHDNYIVSKGGKVDAIPMNTLKNRIGNGKRVTKAQLQEYFLSHSKPDQFPTQHAFVKDVFENLLKAGSYQTTYETATQELFDRYNYKRTSWPDSMPPMIREMLKNTNYRMDYLIVKGTFEKDYKIVDGSLRDYLVEGLIGGRRVWTPDNTERALEFRSNYLMPGDIYVRALFDTDGEDFSGTRSNWGRVFVYMGDDTYMYYDLGDEQVKKASFKDTPNEFWDAFTKDFFYVLRSSQ